MKKVFTLFVFLVLVASVSLAEVDLSGLSDMSAKSDQELISMYLEIQSILLSRSKAYSIKLDAGEYVVGVDIPAGSYRVECKGAYSSSLVKIHEHADSSSFPKTYTLAELYGSSVIGKLDLEDANVLDIIGSSVTVTAYSAANIEIDVEVKQDESTENTVIDKDGFKVSPGKYLVGDEIPAGTYRVVCEGAYSMAMLSVFDSKTSIYPSYDVLMSELLGSGEIGKLVLKKGDYVQISDGSVMFYPYEGVKK